ncbi:hypothetical protein [Cryptosporangium sp. NPDC051539]|uniref:hypothetical protein n=1 Tax=Cryptosporangium sp. NPDC051539 TaxID=3363962 RepID=UPI0037B53B04
MRNTIKTRRSLPIAVGILVGVIVAALGVLVAPAPASAAIPGYVVRPGVSDSNSVSPKSATARCLGNERVIGTGYKIEGAPTDVVLASLVPASKEVIATAGEDADGTNTAWTLTAFAVCATSMGDAKIIPATQSPTTFQPFLQAEQPCTGGTQLIGSGAALSPNAAGHVTITRQFFQGGGTSLTTANVSDPQFTQNWSVTTYAICVPTHPGQSTPGGSSPFDNKPTKTATANCGSGQVGTTAGWSVGTFGGPLIDSAVPSATGVVTTGTIDDDGIPGNAAWSIGTQSLCFTRN